MKKTLLSASLFVTSATVAFAQTVSIGFGTGAAQGQVNGGALLNLLNLAQTIVSRLVPFAVGVAVLAFFWFLIKFITQGGESSDAKAVSLKGMGMSILALFVMVSIWGIIGFFGSIFGIGQGGNVPIPSVPVPGSSGGGINISL
jgi:hypothetical protein